MPEVTVVLGIIEHQGEILIAKKTEAEHPFGLGGKWILPGGEVQPGEILRQALEHELLQGTGLPVELIECLGVGTQHRWGTFTRTLYILCAPLDPTIRTLPGKDLQELKWVGKAQALAELDLQVVEAFPPQVLEYFVGLHHHDFEHWSSLHSTQNRP